jgi:hypothetical protein
MSNFGDENPNVMEQVLAAPAENVEEEYLALLVVSEEGGEEAEDSGQSSGGSGDPN